MQIKAITDKPQQLITAIEKAIKDGDLKTWKKIATPKGEILYSHTPAQWDEKAMFKVSVEDEYVSFDIVWWEKAGEPDDATKGYITGRFTEVLIVHFRIRFNRLILV